MKLERNTKTIRTRLMISMNFRISFLFFLLTAFALKVDAQDIYPLHPTVGDTIDKFEKLDYSLFPSVGNENFDFAIIRYHNGNYFLETKTDSLTEKLALSKELIIEQQQNIEKINAYYRLKAADTSKTKAIYLDENRPTGKEPVYLNEQLKKQISKDARMRIRLQEDRRRMLENQRGIQNNQLHIEFK